MDIKDELQQFIETTKPQAKETSPEALVLQERGKQLESFLPPVESAPAPVEPPSAAPVEAVGDVAAPPTEVDPLKDFYPPVSGVEEAAPQQPKLDDFLPEGASAGPSYGELFAGGLARGTAQVASAPVDLAGIAAEAGGNTAAAEEAYKRARQIESYAPERFQKFENIHDGESLANWLVEFAGEQAPTLLALFTGAGGGAMVARTVGMRVIKDPRLATKIGLGVGGGATGAALETAGAGSEFKQRTGSYNPGRATAVGVANGLLEFYGPGKLLTTKGGTLTEELVKGMSRESLTELTQELNTAANAADIDENYDFFSRETLLRGAEAFVGGGVAGGGMAAGVRGVQKLTGTEPEVNFDGKDTWANAITYLRERANSARQVAQDSILEFVGRKQDDALETSPLFREVQKVVKKDPLQKAAMDRVLDFEDSLIPRYALQLPDGKWDSTFYTDTEVERVLALQPQGQKTALKEVDMKSLRAGGITATVQDLPVDLYDSRIFFPPWVKAKAQDALRAEYQQLIPKIQQLDSARLLQKPEEITQLEAEVSSGYAALAAKGLRVVPSRGAGFIYKGDFAGKDTDLYNKPQRSPVVLLATAGNKTFAPEPGAVFTKPGMSNGIQTWEAQNYRPIALDMNKLTAKDGVTVPALYTAALEQTLTNNPKAFMFRDKLKPEEQAALVAEYVAGYKVTWDRPSFAKTMFNKGIVLKPNFGESFILSRDGANSLKKFTVGTATPSEKEAKFDLPTTIDIPPSPPKYFQLTNLVPPSPNLDHYRVAKRLEQVLEPLAVRLNELLVRKGLPQFRVAIDRTPGMGSTYNPNIGLITVNTAERGVEARLKSKILDPSTLGLISFLHEFGHHVTMASWRHLSATQQQLIMQGYEKARLRYALTGDASTTQISFDGAYTQFQPGYSLTFMEYLAEQYRRYALKNYIFDPKAKYFQGAADLLTEAAKLWKENVSADVLANMLAPAWEFHGVMDYLESAGFRGQEQAQGKVSFGTFPASHVLPITSEVVEGSVEYDLTLKMVEEWKKALPADVNVEVNQGVGPAGVGAEFAQNDLLPGKSTIRLWMGSLQRRGGQNPIAHEATHAIWHLLTPGQRQILVAAGRSAKVMDKALERKYFSDYKQQLKKLNINEQEAVELAKGYVEEEYAAWLVGKRFNGADFGPQANSLLDKIIQLFESVKNMLLGRGFSSAEKIMRMIQAGEIAQRQARRLDTQTRVVKRQLEPGEPIRIYPQPGGVYIFEQIYLDGKTRKYVAYKYDKPVSGTERKKIETITNLGKEIGYVDLALKGKRGFEVEMVEIQKDFRFKASGVDYSDQLYNFIANQTQQTMRPSGLLTENGHKMWTRRDPASTRWHVWDEVSKMWYSPNRIRANLQIYREEAERQAAYLNKPKEKTAGWVNVQKYQRLMAKVDPQAWQDPNLSVMFSIDPSDPISREAMLGALEGESKQIEGQLEQAITGSTQLPANDPFMEDYVGKIAEAINTNAAKLGVDPDVGAPPQLEAMIFGSILNRYGINNPQLGPMLSGQNLGAEADRISWFTKLFISIKQMAWNNPHIQQLRDYVSAKEGLNALRMKWIERAQETVRAWSKLANNQQRDAVSELLFWATEMEYLGPNDPPRWPTPQEVAAAARRLRVSPEGLAIYARVQKDMMDYLAEVEAVMIESINRQYTQMGPNGRLALSVAGQAELAALQADLANMRKKPYFPMVRFGEWTVTVRDPAANDKIVWFSAYPTARERDAAAMQIKRRFPVENMQVGRMSPEVYEFQGLPPSVLKYIKNNFPGQLTQAQKDYLDQVALQMSPEKSFRKRWLKRKGTSGYSLDGMRVYAHYFQGAGSYLAKIKYKPVMEEAISSLKSTFKLMKDSSKREQISKFMEADMKFSMEPSRDWHKFRSAVSMWQLGFSPAAAFVNLTQTPVFTLPYFAGIWGNKAVYFKAKGLMVNLTKSTKRIVKYNPSQVDPQFAAVRQALINMGKLETGAAPELGSYAQADNLLQSVAGTATQRAWRSFSRTSMWMFQQAERLNREIVVGMGWELSADLNHPHMQEIQNQYGLEILELANKPVDVGNGQQVSMTYDTAARLVAIREAISRTQFEYGRDYRPPFLRSPLASSFLVFFGYIQSAVYAFGKNPGQLQLFLTYAFLFGAMGLPGAEDLEELLNAIARKYFGKDFSLEDKARELVRELTQGTVFDETGPDLFLHGISRYSFGPGLLQEGLGTPQFDASANGSMGRLIPGFAETMRAVGRGDDWKGVTSELARDVAGAGFGQIFPMLQFLSGIASGDISIGDWKKWESVMPRAVKAMSKAGRYYVDEGVETNSGSMLTKFDVRDPDDLATLIAQGLGFTPTQVSMNWDLIIKQQDALKFYQNERTTLMAQLAYAIRNKDSESKAKTVASIKKFNLEMKELGLGAMGITSESVKQSVKGRLERGAKQELGLPAQRSATPLYQKIEKLFPGVERVK